MKHTVVGWIGIVGLFCVGCPPGAAVTPVGVTDLGPLETTGAVKARDGGYSVLFRGRSVWLYGDSILSLEGEDGSSWRDNSWSWTTDLDASDGTTGFSEPVDSLGAPEEYFPETDEEAEFNAAHRGDDCIEPCGARKILWPMDAVYDPQGDRVLASYVKIYGEPGAWNFYGMGYGMAVWEDPDGAVERPEVAPGTDEPTLLFTDEELNFGVAMVVEGVDLYAYACESRGGDWGKPCLLARVGLADVLDRDAWRFWDGDQWSSQVDDAQVLFEGNSQMTVHYNPLLDAYLAVHVDGVSDDIVMRTAPALEGPWSESVYVFTAEPAHGDGFVYCGLGHEELMGEGGGMEYISYYRGTGDWTGEVRLVEVEVSP